MEQITSQSQLELEQQGWEFRGEQLPPEIPVATVYETGRVSGDIIAVIQNALTENKPWELFMVGRGGTKYRADAVADVSDAGQDKVRFYTYPLSRKQTTIGYDGTFISWENA